MRVALILVVLLALTLSASAWRKGGGLGDGIPVNALTNNSGTPLAANSGDILVR